MKVLVTGANGQLGSEIKELSVNFPNHQYFFEGSEGLNITDAKEVEAYIQSKEIDIVINCAAYTQVDKAESEEIAAEKVNAEGVKNISKALEQRNGKLIHISTDYVFNGKNYLPYKEDDAIDPIGVYGRTKREGEEFFLNSKVEGAIIRTAWVYSSYGNNFVKTMMRLGQDRDELNVIFDQVGSPTYAKDLAEVCLKMLDFDFNGKQEVYHYSNEGVLSWYDFAKSIMEIGGISCSISPIETKDYPTPARRPNYSLLNKSKIKKDLGIEIPYWKDSLKKCIKELEK